MRILYCIKWGRGWGGHVSEESKSLNQRESKIVLEVYPKSEFDPPIFYAGNRGTNVNIFFQIHFVY
jgi:hypothetical protein